MISKSLYIKLMKEDGKRRLWVFALTFLLAFFAMTVATAMYISRHEIIVAYRDEIVASVLQYNSPGTVFLTLISALLCGFSSFSYLHSKKKVDFYHSLPIKREKLFLVNFINGVLIYVVSYLINLLFCLVLVAANGGNIMSAIAGGFSVFSYNLSYFLLIYSVVVLSAMLTGNLVVNMLGCVVLLFYGPVLCMLIEGYYSTMFITYYSRSGSLLNYLLERLSPVTAYICYHSAWGALLAAALIAALSLVLYRIRRSEAAGKAMAFKPSMAPIKIAIVLASSMLSGLIFYDIVATGIWMLFGVLCGCLLSYCMIEVIYHFDFRKAFAHKFQLIGCTAGCILIFSIFQFDLLGYDSYLPKESSVESVAIAWDDKSWVSNKTAAYRNEFDGYFMNYGENNINYRLSNMKITDFELVHPVLERAVELAKIGRKDGESQWLTDHGETNGYFNQHIVVRYRLKSGRIVYRSYSVWLDDMQNEVYKIWDSVEYKEGVYPILNMDPASLSQIAYREINDNFDLTLSPEQMQELLAAYQKDLLESRSRDAAERMPIGTLSFIDENLRGFYLQEVEMGNLTDNFLEWSVSVNPYPVFSSYGNTNALLTSFGVKLGESLAAKDISEIRISDYAAGRLEDEEMRLIGDSEIISENGYYSVGYDELEQIREILPAMVYEPYAIYNDYKGIVNSLDVRADVKKSNGSKQTYSFELIGSKLPEFVKKDLHFEMTRPEE